MLDVSMIMMNQRKEAKEKGGKRHIRNICGGRHIRAVGCMLEIEGWVAGGTLEDEEEEEEDGG